MATKKKKSAKRGAAKKKRGSGKRELLETRGDRRYVRRTGDGEFKEGQVNVGRSLAADRRTTAKNTAKPGHGDEGDVRRGKASKKRKSASTRKSGSKRKTGAKRKTGTKRKSASKRK
jgi:hypothetical protein